MTSLRVYRLYVRNTGDFKRAYAKMLPVPVPVIGHSTIDPQTLTDRSDSVSFSLGAAAAAAAAALGARRHLGWVRPIGRGERGWRAEAVGEGRRGRGLGAADPGPAGGEG